MLVSFEYAAEYLEIPVGKLTFEPKYRKFCKNLKFDMDAYQAWAAEKHAEEDRRIDTLNFAEFVIEQIGIYLFYEKIPKKYHKILRNAIRKNSVSSVLADMIEEIHGAEWREVYKRDAALKKPKYVPLEDREPLTKAFLKKEYWERRQSVQIIADALRVPVQWVLQEIRRLGMQKKKNGVKLRGRKGYVMPEDERKKRRNQPHAKPVVQICPRTFKVIKEYRSLTATEQDGFYRKNVEQAMKGANLSRGYLWASKGMEKPVIEFAKKKGNLSKKLQKWAYERPSRDLLKKLYIDRDMTLIELGKRFKCHPTTIARVAGEYGLKKRTGALSVEELQEMYKTMSIQEIAYKTGRTYSTIATYLSRNGISNSKMGDIAQRRRES